MTPVAIEAGTPPPTSPWPLLTVAALLLGTSGLTLGAAWQPAPEHIVAIRAWLRRGRRGPR
jgi:hypothetical protein